MLLAIVAGARPNFMKVGPIINAINKERGQNSRISYRLIHTGQHYDANMSENFFTQLEIPKPDVNLESGGGTQAEQTASIMVKFERDLIDKRPDVVVVVGDVTSTMACTITAKKLRIPVVHVEAGIRSGDLTMPEEINRIVTDSICDHFFTTSESACDHLRNSGASDHQIHFVGNTMIDTLYQNLHRLRQPDVWKKNNLKNQDYFLLTLHRPSNVDHAENLAHVLKVILSNAHGRPVIFPVHPRTKKIVDMIGFSHENLIMLEPMGYLEFVYMMKNALAIITDSGGVTEESTVLKVPCMTLRNSTERPETIAVGTNELVGTTPDNIIPYLQKVKDGKWKKSGIPALWDGRAGERIVKKLIELYGRSN